MLNFLERLISRALVWVLVRQAERLGLDLPHARKVAQREVAAISETIHGAAIWQKSEQAILTERLSRRYDLGMALNESANRAMEAKKEARATADVPRLTAGQMAALKVQEEYLARLIRRS